jgi:hypothetical protein
MSALSTLNARKSVQFGAVRRSMHQFYSADSARIKMGVTISTTHTFECRNSRLCTRSFGTRAKSRISALKSVCYSYNVTLILIADSG